MWLRENIDGAPVIAEVTGNPYSEYGRVAANTGLPTLLGWANHEYQWRGSTPEPPERQRALQDIYNSTDWAMARDLMLTYGVEYVYVGALEQANYTAEGLAKFAQYMDVAYQNGSVVIYQWELGE